MLPQTLLTRKILPRLLSRGPRSAIINVSSLWGEQLLPKQTLYCATKRYNDFLSR